MISERASENLSTKLNIMKQNSLTTSDAPVAGPGRTGTSTTSSPWIFGTIRSVEPTREMLFLHRAQDDTEQIIHWLPHTRFRYHGAEVRPDALHEGQQISVQFSSDGGLKFAMEIDIVVEPPVRESSAALRRSLWPSRSGKKAGN